MLNRFHEYSPSKRKEIKKERDRSGKAFLLVEYHQFRVARLPDEPDSERGLKCLGDRCKTEVTASGTPAAATRVAYDSRPG